MSKYLVTGGAGFIGSNLVNLLLEDSTNTVTIVDNLSMGKKSNIPKSQQVVFFERSITDHQFMRNLLIKNKFDYIILLAAVASVADSVQRPYETHGVNQEANLNIIETLRVEKIPIKKLFFSSSAAVYGDLLDLPKREDMPVKPLTQYAVDKYATEQSIINYSQLYNIPMVCARFFNVYGPNQNPKSPYSGVLSIVLDCLVKSKPFTFFGDGEQTRDFTFVGDVVRAICGLLWTSEVTGEVFNIANGRQTTLKEVIQKLEALTKKKLIVTYDEARKGDIQKSYADTSKIDQLKLMHHTSLIDGLTKYVASIDT